MGYNILNQLVFQEFPQVGISLAFGYGSGVVKQRGNNSNGGDMIDIIFSVDDTNQWHKENLAKNKQHYSVMRYLLNDIQMITKIQEHYGAKIYFNPYVDICNLSVKYGVIKTDHLIDDLNDWNHLYVAGRLHKPVEFLVNVCDRNERLRSALRFNKESAIRAALLQLPEQFEPISLYKVITNLSYQGDLRMLFGEDRNKIDNIVSRQIDRFEQIYLPVLRMSPSFKDYVHWHEGKHTFTQDVSPKSVNRSLKLLPKNLRRELCKIQGRDVRSVEGEVILSSLSRSLEIDKIVACAISNIVRKSSLTQSLKGLITAGFAKSMRYSQRKLLKSISSRFEWRS